MAYSQVAIIMLKKFSKARGEAVFMEEVTQEQRLESAKRRRQGRGQHPQGNPPTGWGHNRDGGGGPPGPPAYAGRRGWPISLASRAQEKTSRLTMGHVGTRLADTLAFFLAGSLR